jgi:hypothetical protein
MHEIVSGDGTLGLSDEQAERICSCVVFVVICLMTLVVTQTIYIYILG